MFVSSSILNNFSNKITRLKYFTEKCQLIRLLLLFRKFCVVTPIVFKKIKRFVGSKDSIYFRPALWHGQCVKERFKPELLLTYSSSSQNNADHRLDSVEKRNKWVTCNRQNSEKLSDRPTKTNNKQPFFIFFVFCCTFKIGCVSRSSIWRLFLWAYITDTLIVFVTFFRI